ncbi:WD repeat-containing protein on Y chromosome [Megalops cyprinoides]|uniref:WD repeat-containing protein on Y chromosome n=1 Tax=Megalops cyprinoides TaxID=118141 RepID=UPI001863FCB3|nr:WD repeat-containing protein on Y chromosome [Megalops cyprinoides]
MAQAIALQRQLLSEASLLELEDFPKRQGALQRKAKQCNETTSPKPPPAPGAQGRPQRPRKMLKRNFNQQQHVRLEEELQLDHLLLLREAFANHMPVDVGSQQRVGGSELACGRQPGRGSRRQAGSMSLEEFQAALSAMLGSECWKSQTELLFNKMDTSCDGYVDWDEFCTYMLLEYREKDRTVKPRDALLSPQPLIRHCPCNKQEPNTRVLAVPYPSPLRFISISKEGVLTVWNRKLHPLKSEELSGDSSDGGGNRRRFRHWTTDAVYMPNVHKIAVATTSRDIHFFDISTGNLFEEFYLFGMNNVPKSLCYWYDTKSPGCRSLLLWGDDEGSVGLLWFLQPHAGLFETPFSDENGPQRVFMQDISVHSRLVSYQVIHKIHQEPINRIIYEPHADLIITSSGSASTSVVIMDVSLKKPGYIWKIKKGVKCFDFCKSLNLLVTGGMDPSVRLWNQYVTSRPVAVLHGHHTTVLDVAIYEPLGQIFSYSMDAVLKIWDISSQRCLRTLLLKFPCVQAGHALEHGNFPFLLLSAAPHVLLVSCRDYLGLLRLQQGDPKGGQLLTHNAPLSSALYNPLLKQVVTGCDDSSLAVWDVETGEKYLQLSDAHGQEEITCMAFDTSQRCLITGARNGTIKVWSLLNGHNLHKLEAVAEAEVTGVISLHDDKLLAVGWSQQISQYNITNPNNTYVQADLSWKSGQLHKDDILAVDHCPAQRLLATGSVDGELIIWTLDTQRPLQYLRKALSARKQAPVDRLLFLQRRAQGSEWRSRPLLVSSEAGWLCWWSIAGPRHRHGHFYAPEKGDESVLGLSSDQENRILVSGDTAGSIQVWDISHFALGLGDESAQDCPPLLHRWRGHENTVVSVELLVFSGQLFLVSASADRRACLWTCDGHYVGFFGQEQRWSLCDPTTYQHPSTPGSCEEDNTYVQADLSWKSGQLHKDDILAVDHCPAQRLLATGSVDGELIIWTLDTQRPLQYLRKALSASLTTLAILLTAHAPAWRRTLWVRPELWQDSLGPGPTIADDTPGRRGEEAGSSGQAAVPPTSGTGERVEEQAPPRQLRGGLAMLVEHCRAQAQTRQMVMSLSPDAGHFYAPEKGDESVLGLSSDQENRILVSGDTAGSIQVWDISHFALGLGDESAQDCPPLLHRWRGHENTVVSVELLVFSGQLFLVSASADRRACLWTCDGHYVGFFGQEQRWSLCDPTTYQHPRNPCGQETEEEKEKQEERAADVKNQSQDSEGTSDQARSGEKHSSPLLTDRHGRVQNTSLGFLHGCPIFQLCQNKLSAALPPKLGSGQLLPLPLVPREPQCPTPDPLDSPAKAEHTKIALGLQVEKDMQRKAAARQQRRLAFGHIDASKISLTASICTPFQALSMPECQEVRLPSDLPMRPWMTRQGLKVREADLMLLPLTSSSPKANQGGDKA